MKWKSWRKATEPDILTAGRQLEHASRRGLNIKGAVGLAPLVLSRLPIFQYVFPPGGGGLNVLVKSYTLREPADPGALSPYHPNPWDNYRPYDCMKRYR